MMTKFLIAAIWLFLSMSSVWGQTGHPISITNDGWTVTVDAEHATLSVSRKYLGAILKDVQLNLRSGQRLRPLRGWSIEKEGEREVTILTSGPRTAWVLELCPQALGISTTSAEGVLTAEAPASAERIVARLLDPQGTPVKWMMTTEAKNAFGATQPSEPSFLPRNNPDVMYFALGQVSSSNLHALFDRPTDTAIQFSELTRMQRNYQNQNLLDLTIPVPGHTRVRILPDYFTKTLGLPDYVPFDDRYFRRAAMVWDSWSSYYDQVTEQDIVRNTDWIAAHLKAYGFQYVQLDDGYDRGKNGEHYWIEKWDRKKFPHGPEWLANYIKSKGLEPGLWLVPQAYAGAVKQHPDWYLYYYNGTPVLDYNTPVLDPTNPEVLDFLKKEFTILDGWGFDYYKFDGQHDFLKDVPGIDYDRLAEKSAKPHVDYRNYLRVIRDTVGPRRFIEGDAAGSPLNGIGYFNSYFTGDDPYNSWLGMYRVFSSLNANAFLNHIVVYIMPGEMDVGPPMSVAEAMKRRVSPVVETARSRENHLAGFGTTLAEARTVVSHVALSGTVYSLGSLVAELPEERTKLLQRTLPTMPILPIDLFSRGTDMRMWDIFKHTNPDDYIHNYPEILDLKVNAPSGIYDVVGMTNWRSWTMTRALDFADKLGLSPEASYVVFDFWRQKLLGVFRGRMDVTIDPFDTRVLLIHPMLHRPELIGTSRHITGAYSILTLNWDSSQNTLSGSSRTVPGEDYTLWIYVPEGAEPFQIMARTTGRREIPVQHELHGESLSVSFLGQQKPVDWEIKFHIHDTR